MPTIVVDDQGLAFIAFMEFEFGAKWLDYLPDEFISMLWDWFSNAGCEAA